MLLLQQMMILFFLMMIGYMLKRKGIIDTDTCKKLSWIVVHIANPALILSGSIERSEPVQLQVLCLCMGIAVVMFGGLIVAGYIVAGILHVPEKSRGVFRIMMVFSNIGFMGFPVIRAVYGSDALIYASLFLIPYNILLYTYGIRDMKGKDRNEEGVLWRKILNAGVVSSLLSLMIAVFQIQVPQFAAGTVSSLSNLAAPLSMIVIGASMTEIRVCGLFTDWKLLVFSAIKLLAVPAAGMFLLSLFVSDRMLLGVCLVMLSTPVGSMTAMLAQQYGGDYELDARGVALTTLLSVGTMPLVSLMTSIK